MKRKVLSRIKSLPSEKLLVLPPIPKPSQCESDSDSDYKGSLDDGLNDLVDTQDLHLLPMENLPGFKADNMLEQLMVIFLRAHLNCEAGIFHDKNNFLQLHRENKEVKKGALYLQDLCVSHKLKKSGLKNDLADWLTIFYIDNPETFDQDTDRVSFQN